MIQPYHVKRDPERFMKEIEETRVPYGMIAVWGLGQASFIIKGGDTTLYIDPFVMDEQTLASEHGLMRTYPAPIDPVHIRHADYCLITHEHIDHLDPVTVSAMAKTCEGTVYIAPRCCTEVLLQQGVPTQKLLLADVNTPYTSEDQSIVISPVPAAHEELEQDEQGFHRYVGYIIRFNGVTIYHSGDTLVYEGLAERLSTERIELALLPINGRDAFRTSEGIVGNMNYREAAELAVRSGFRMTVPMHYDLFAGNSERPGYFIDYVYDHYPHLPVHMIARGERYIYVGETALR